MSKCAGNAVLQEMLMKYFYFCDNSLSATVFHDQRRTGFHERKIKEIKRTSQEPLGVRQKCVVYKIPCTCQNTVYVGETWRLFQTRKKEHMDKVRLTNEDLHKGNTLSADRPSLIVKKTVTDSELSQK